MNAFVSRPIAPTRRIALGDVALGGSRGSSDGAGLLSAVIARYSSRLDEETRSELAELMAHVGADHHVPQPMMRHRFQTDRVGLQHITYRLLSWGDRLRLEFPTEEATPTQHVLVAVYAAGTIDPAHRPRVISMMNRAMSFPGGDDEDLLRFLGGGRITGRFALSDPVLWALDVLAFDLAPGDDADRNGAQATGDQLPTGGAGTPGGADERPRGLPAGLRRMPTRSEIQRAFRRQLHRAHPDHGAESAGAAARIADLTEARRILLDR